MEGRIMIDVRGIRGLGMRLSGRRRERGLKYVGDALDPHSQMSICERSPQVAANNVAEEASTPSCKSMNVCVDNSYMY